MEFLWNNGIESINFDTLKGNMETNVLIIGGGMAGVLTAYKLQQLNIKYTLIEANKIGQGITKGTTAVITAQHDTLYKDLIEEIGFNNTKNYLFANLDAVEQYKNITTNIDCDFEVLPSIVYSNNDNVKMQKEAEALKKLGYDATYIDGADNLPFKISAGIKFKKMAQFHPLKFLYSIASGLNIYENTKALKIDKNTVTTNNGIIKADKIIIATHFPILNNSGLYFMKQYQKRSYVIAYEYHKELGFTIENIDSNGFYIRSYNNLLIVGGAEHRTGKTSAGYKPIEEFVQNTFGNLTEKLRWSNQDCITLDNAPYIGVYSKSTPHIFVATGFNFWGMTHSMVASDILSCLIQEKEYKYASAFNTDRSIFKKQLLDNIATSTIDMLTPTTKRCSHMGCALKYNKYEHSWDCPCHGSRFSSEGKLIDNPAIKDL